MEIKVRPPEPTCTVELNRPKALDLYVFLSEFEERAVSEESVETVKEVKQTLREFLVKANR